MANEDQWIELLKAVRGPLPEAYIAMGQLVKTNKSVRWNPVKIPDGAPYLRLPIFSSELGDVSVVYFRGPSVTVPHRWPGARIFHALLDGDLNQRTWSRRTGTARATGERRVTAPDLLFTPRNETVSFSSPEGAICIVVQSAPREGLEIDDLSGQRTLSMEPGTELLWPPDTETIASERCWG